MLAGKVGRAVASPRVTVADDPTDGASSGACAFDGEGVPSRRNVLLEGGVLRGFLADSFWGRRLGCGTTASCRRDSAKLPPGPGAGGLRLEAGTEGLPDLLRAAGRCILVTEFLGLHTADPVSGDFAVGATGLLCEGGEAVRPLRSFAATGNVLDLLARVEGAGSDVRWFGTVAAPSLLVSSLSVGGE
jgi:PmbA protein